MRQREITVDQTMKIPPDRLEKYFDTFSRHFVMRESTNAIDVEVLSSRLGDQFEAEGAQLAGISYDPHNETVDIEVKGGNHRVYKPTEVWVVEETGGFLKAIELVQSDGTREILRIRRLGVRERDD
jgi:hypothetical protein